MLQETTREHSAILSTFIKLPYVFKTFVLSIFERQYYTGFAVVHKILVLNIEGSDESAYVQTHQSHHCSHSKKMDVDEDSDQILDL